jgi:hypothetical protein
VAARELVHPQGRHAASDSSPVAQPSKHQQQQQQQHLHLHLLQFVQQVRIHAVAGRSRFQHVASPTPIVVIGQHLNIFSRRCASPFRSCFWIAIRSTGRSRPRLCSCSGGGTTISMSSHQKKHATSAAKVLYHSCGRQLFPLEDETMNDPNPSNLARCCFDDRRRRLLRDNFASAVADPDPLHPRSRRWISARAEPGTGTTAWCARQTNSRSSRLRTTAPPASVRTWRPANTRRNGH